MKATNIFQSLKSKGVCGTDGIPPKLPGVSSPLDKKLVGNQENLNPELRAAIEDAPESPANYGSALKKKSCGSPVELDIENVAGRPNPKKAIRKAKRKANKGHKVGVRASRICKRSTRGKGSTYRN